MDGRKFPAPGACPACGMRPVPKVPPFEPASLAEGAGLFTAAGGRGHEAARIQVHYYRPRRFSRRSPILLVIPGEGRDADEYRDAWIEAADSTGLFVAALGYPAADYDFAAYQMGGVVKDLVIRNMPRDANGEPPSRISLRDEDISLAFNPRPDEWLFRDFDRIFGLIVRATRSERSGYDLFGHSAGGQILHRAVLFNPRSRAERIVAGNAGLYTYPDFDLPLPNGLAGAGLTGPELKPAFAARLTLLLGERDDAVETRGTMLHTPTIDRFGIDRLSRGRRFFELSQGKALALSAPFNWKLEVVPGVGHDFRAMTTAAARYLYDPDGLGGFTPSRRRPPGTARTKA